MVGVTPLLLIFSTLGGAFTLGIPPGEMDAQLQNITPHKCLVFHQWAAAAEADPGSENRLEQLIAEPDIQLALVHLRGELTRLVSGFASRDKSAGVVPFTQLLIEGSRALYRHPGAVYLWAEEGKEGPQAIRAALVVNAADSGDRLDNLLTELLKATAGENVVASPTPGGSFQRATIVPEGPPLFWGRYDGYLVVTLGEQALDELLERWEGPAPAWLTDLLEKMPVKRRATLSFLDLQQGADQLGRYLGSQAVTDEAIKALGLDNLLHAAFTTGISGPDWTSHGLVVLDGEPRGPLKTLTSSGLSLEDLAGIPADALLALAGKINLDQLYGVTMDLARTFNPRAESDFNEIVTLLEEELELRFREDLLQSFGENWGLYCSRQGSLATGWVATAEIKNREIIERVVEILRTEMENFGPASPRIHKEKLGNASIYIVDIPDDDVLLLPTLAITDNHLVAGLYPQAVRGHLRRPPTILSLSGTRNVSDLFVPDRQLLGIAVTDNKSLFEFAYPLAQVGIHMAASEISRGFPRDGKALARPAAPTGHRMDASSFPPAEVIARHLGQERIVIYRDPIGIHLEQRGDFPGNVTLPAMLPFLWLSSSPAAVIKTRETGPR